MHDTRGTKIKQNYISFISAGWNNSNCDQAEMGHVAFMHFGAL